MTTPKSYELIGCKHECVNSNCKLCGVYLAQGVEAYKTFRYFCEHSESNTRYLSSMRKKNSKTKILTSIVKSPEMVYDFLQGIVDKFEFSIETLALGLYLYNQLVHGDPDRSEYSVSMEFYASLCLMIAAKAIELDRHIPYYSRYIKYGCKDHTKREYEKMEVRLIEEFEWNLQKPTFVSFVSFYLNNGIVFSDEEFSQKKVFLVEEKIKERMLNMLRSG